VDHCFANAEFVWLGEVVVALATTGLRISELADLRWTDLDLQDPMIRLIDTRAHASKVTRGSARATKSHRDRALPISEELLPILLNKVHEPDGRVFHGPLGGRLKPDTVRRALERDVLEPLAPRFPAPPGQKCFRSGRVHSFRHYFCSIAANSGIPEPALMTWLGHRDSKMVKHYYHLHEDEARRQMAKMEFVGKRPAKESAK
jgi:integrase